MTMKVLLNIFGWFGAVLLVLFVLGCQEETTDTVPKECTFQYDPVCAAKDSGIRCVTTPCPTEVYQTYSNACTAGVDKARVLFSGECGDLEGKFIEEDKPVACTKEYAPVCGVVTNIKPCLIMPCPASHWATFGNKCMAEVAGATHVEAGGCGANGERVLGLQNAICPANYDPVCAKDEYPINCLVAPCTSHKYSTFSNACAAAAEFAETAFKGECGEGLEGSLVFGQPLVKMHETLTAQASDPSVVISSILGDVAYVTLGYSGCDQQHFDLYIDTAFMESFPVQVKYQFTPQQEQSCDAAFLTKFEYDLTPLKAHYLKSYQSTTGSVNLGELGLYEF